MVLVRSMLMLTGSKNPYKPVKEESNGIEKTKQMRREKEVEKVKEMR